MKNLITVIFLSFILIQGCGKETQQTAGKEPDTKSNANQSAVKDNESQKDILKIALASPDHTTLVAALKAAELTDVLANSGPFTVFAPTNAAFNKIPKETLDELLKPENKNKLADILKHHVYVGVFSEDLIKDGQSINMVDGNNATFSKKDGATYIDKSKIGVSVKATNGLIYVVDEVVLPASK